jgi:hypothetical protein
LRLQKPVKLAVPLPERSTKEDKRMVNFKSWKQTGAS